MPLNPPTRSKTKRSKKKVERIPEPEVFKLARKFDKARKLKDKYDKARKELQSAIVAQMELRKVKSITDKETGLRITEVRSEYVSYDPDQLRELLPPKKFRKVTQVVVDKDTLGAAVQAGEIDAEIVAKVARISYSEPYIRTGTSSD